MPLTHFSQLSAWQRAMDLVVEVYQLTDSFPSQERFGLTVQARRSAVSIPSNIAEGFCRRSLPAYINHLNIALGSEGELYTHLEISLRLRLAPADQICRSLHHLSEVGRMVQGLATSLERRLRSGGNRRPIPDP